MSRAARRTSFGLVIAVAVVACIAVASFAATAGAAGGSGPRPHALTEAQRACLSSQGIEKPSGRPTQAQRQAFEVAAKECGITLPPRHGPRLSEEQRACLSSKGVEKPAGKPTAAQRAAFEAAAEECGIELPTRP